MNKYFSYDPFEGEVNYHGSEKEAKTEALKLAEAYYDDCREWDGSFDDTTINQIERICYGLVLGNIDLPTRPVNDDDDESSKENFSYIVEHPVIVELEKTSKWIKCSEQLPALEDDKTSESLLLYGSEVFSRFKYRFVGFYDGEDFYTNGGVIMKVTHWQPLPEPPND